jgi:hypothetical protein
VYDLLSPDGGIGLDLIIASIQDLITSHHSILTVFRQLEVLSVRYRLSQRPEEPWNGQLSYDFTIVDDLYNKNTWTIADSWTYRHKELFMALRDDEYPESKSLQEIKETWNRLSKQVEECALVGGLLVNGLAYIERVRKGCPVLKCSD